METLCALECLLTAPSGILREAGEGRWVGEGGEGGEKVIEEMRESREM